MSIDYEAIAWAYNKLCAYGSQNASMENAMMMDRLNLMLLMQEEEQHDWENEESRRGDYGSQP